MRSCPIIAEAFVFSHDIYSEVPEVVARSHAQQTAMVTTTRGLFTSMVPHLLSLVYVDKAKLEIYQRSQTFQYTQSISFRGSEFNDEEVADCLKCFHCLRRVEFWCTSITDNIVPILNSVRTLREVDFTDNKNMSWFKAFVGLLSHPSETLRTQVCQDISAKYSGDDDDEIAIYRQHAVDFGALKAAAALLEKAPIDLHMWQSALFCFQEMCYHNSNVKYDDMRFALPRIDLCLQFEHSMVRGQACWCVAALLDDRADIVAGMLEDDQHDIIGTVMNILKFGDDYPSVIEGAIRIAHNFCSPQLHDPKYRLALVERYDIFRIAKVMLIALRERARTKNEHGAASAASSSSTGGGGSSSSGRTQQRAVAAGGGTGVNAQQNYVGNHITTSLLQQQDGENNSSTSASTLAAQQELCWMLETLLREEDEDALVRIKEAFFSSDLVPILVEIIDPVVVAASDKKRLRSSTDDDDDDDISIESSSRDDDDDGNGEESSTEAESREELSRMVAAALAHFIEDLPPSIEIDLYATTLQGESRPRGERIVQALLVYLRSTVKNLSSCHSYVFDAVEHALDVLVFLASSSSSSASPALPIVVADADDDDDDGANNSNSSTADGSAGGGVLGEAERARVQAVQRVLFEKPEQTFTCLSGVALHMSEDVQRDLLELFENYLRMKAKAKRAVAETTAKQPGAGDDALHQRIGVGTTAALMTPSVIFAAIGGLCIGIGMGALLASRRRGK